MGFDQVDRQYRPIPPVKLECVGCDATANVSMRQALWWGDPQCPQPLALCDLCAFSWEAPPRLATILSKGPAT